MRDVESPCSSGVFNPRSCFEFRFSNEDEYLYFLVHGFKHFDVSGCGIRFLVDQQVFLNAKGQVLDWSYVHTELRTLDMESFEGRTRALSEAVFGARGCAGLPQLDADQEEFLLHFLQSGTYGNLRVSIEGKLAKNLVESGGNLGAAKRRYLYRRVFLDEAEMQEAFPMFYRHRALRVFLPAYRACRGLVRNPRKIWNEFRTLRRARK